VGEHDQLAETAGLYVLGALDEPDRRAFEAHLAVCSRCAAEVHSFAPVVAGLAASVEGPAPSIAVRQKLVARLRSGPIAARRSMPASWLAAAAAILLAIGLGGYATRLRARVTTLENRLHDEILRADASERRTADARRTAFEAQSSVAILSAPDLARVDLAGQPAAPSASARAFWSRSRGLVFTAANLPQLPAGRTYQLWVLTKEPAPISAGLLAPDASGSVNARFDTPRDLPTPVAMAVTLEPEGGVPSPTGEKFLVGLAH
jgi:anti-sigma-K factor RskA